MTVITGNVANFSTKNKVPLKATKLEIVATQDLHGQSGPWPGGGSKNLFPPKEVTHDGVTLSLRPDGGVNINGRCSAAFNATIKSDIKAGTYVLSCRFTGTLPTEGAARAQIYHQSSGYSKQISNPDASESYTTCIIAEDLTNVEFRIRISANFTYQNVVYYPQFESGSSLTSFVPYSNICPINGTDTVKLTRCGKNMFDLNSLSATDITVQDGEVSGESQRFHDAFGTKTNGIPGLNFKANTVYNVSFWAYTLGEQTKEGTTTGLYWMIYYTDGTKTSRGLPNNISEYAYYSITSESNKTINKIILTYGNGQHNIWHLKDIQLEEASSASDYELYKGVTQTIALGNTYYGGYVHQLQDGRRQLVVTYNIVDLGDLNWSYNSTNSRFDASGFQDSKTWATNVVSSALCSIYKTVSFNSLYGGEDKTVAFDSRSPRIRDSAYTDATAFKTAVTGQKLIYELAEPVIVDITDGEPITSLAGVNNVYASSGSVEVDVPNYFKCASIHATQNSNVVIDTASGSIANFNTLLAMPLLDAQIDVNAVQDLHGQSGAYPAGGGVNKFDKDTMVVSGYYIADTNGQAKPDSGSSCTDYIEINPDTSYYIKSEQTVGQWAAWYDENKTFISGINGYNSVKTSPADAKYVRFTCVRAGSGNVDTFSVNYPSTDTSYHPYSNICPINGVSEVKVGYCDFNQLATLDTSPRQGLTATMDTDGVISLSGVATNSYSNITKTITPLVNHIYFIIKSVISNPNNINFNWSFLNTVKSPYTPGTSETQYTLVKVVSESGSSTGISGFTAGTDFEGVKIKVVCIDLTQALGKEKANYLHTLGDAGVTIARQLFTKDYYPYNEGGTLVSLNDVNGKSICPVDSIQLGDTYYGGRFIQDKDGKRKFVVTRVKKKLSDYTWSLGAENTEGTGFLWYRDFNNDAEINISPDTKCDSFTYQNAQVWQSLHLHSYYAINRYFIFCVENIYDSSAAMLQEYGNVEFTAILKTPIVIDLPDGTPLKSLPGVNNIFADTGDTAVKFRKIGE